jgi:ketosteroid isomerase-like protein
VNDLAQFVASATGRQIEADTALHNGDGNLRKAMWSTIEPVTLFGAATSAVGCAPVHAAFEWLASSFSDCSRFEVEVIAAGVSDDLAYTVAYEHSSLHIDGRAQAYTLRVTHIYRYDNGEWKIVHRHGDRLPEEVDPGFDIAGRPPR